MNFTSRNAVRAMSLEKLLSGGDLRSIGRCDEVIQNIKNQKHFDELFKFLLHKDRIVVMHSSDAIEKITAANPKYLTTHKGEVLELLKSAKDKELKWHLALMASRLTWNTKEFNIVWTTLNHWANDKANSRLVRVGAIQGLYEMTKQQMDLIEDFNQTMLKLEKENIPSINARIRNIRKDSPL